MRATLSVDVLCHDDVAAPQRETPGQAKTKVSALLSCQWNTVVHGPDGGTTP